MAERAILVLEDGSAFRGFAFGASCDAEGEVVFNTGMTGYQEIATDPSYRGQMVVLTYPLIGNYGVATPDEESVRPWIAGLIVRDYYADYSNWRAEDDLARYLQRAGVPAIRGVDTRALTRRLRTRGTMRAVLTRYGGEPDLAALTERARSVTPLGEKDLVGETSAKESYRYEGPDGPLPQPLPGAGRGEGSPFPRGEGGQGVRSVPPRVVVVDCGVKHNILRSLRRRGAEVLVVPHTATAEDVLSLRPDGVVVANGPGDPATLPSQVEMVRGLLASRLPLMGICLGHQLLGQAIGGTTSRLKFGHHGGNHPVKDLTTGRVHVTSQNHEFQVDARSIPPESGFFVSHVNLNDGSVEGLAHPTLPVFSVQYHPEGSPGPQDNQYLFDRFLRLVEGALTPGPSPALRERGAEGGVRAEPTPPSPRGNGEEASLHRSAEEGPGSQPSEWEARADAHASRLDGNGGRANGQ